jgi:SagB-type dehydrogenase family enzyme
MNDDGTTARRFHEATKHSMESIRREPHSLDWPNQPMPWKVYEEPLAEEPLPGVFEPLAVPALPAILSLGEREPPPALGRETIARILHHSLGVTRRREFPDGRVISFRAAACTGALYHVDAYVACADLGDLAGGLYHFDPRGPLLRRLRSGDPRGTLAAASRAEPVSAPPVAIVLASTFWRNAWKYRRRAYRHVFWDGGTILAQLLAEASALGVPARIEVAFADQAIERLCDLDPAREGAFAIVWLGDDGPLPPARAEPALGLATKPLSARETAFPEIAGTHAAGRLASGEEAEAWRRRVPRIAQPPRSAPLVRLDADPAVAAEPLERVVRRRGSTREFDHRSISKTALANLLVAASAPVAADFRLEPAAPLGELYVVVHAVEDVPPGLYRWRAEEKSLEPIALGDRRRDAGFLALGQPLAADAAVNVHAIADLAVVLGALGTRGYRAATLDGAIAGGRLYLAAYAQRFGATGLTFFDDEVTRLFGLDPHRYAVTFLVAAGHAVQGKAR